MPISIIKPSARLAPFIRYYWALEEDFEDHHELVYPTGEIQLLFHYREPFFNRETAGDWSRQPQANFAGQNTAPKIVRSTGRCGVIAAVFHPYGIYPFVKTPLHRMNDLSIPLADIMPSCKDIEEKICLSSSLQDRIDIIETELLRSIDWKNRNHFSMLQRGISLMENSSADLTSIAYDSGYYDQSHFIRKFKNFTGLTPGEFRKVLN